MDEYRPLSEIGRTLRFRPDSIIPPGRDRDCGRRDVAIPDDPRLIVPQPGEDSLVARCSGRPRFLPLVRVLAPQPTPRILDEAEGGVQIPCARPRDLHRGYDRSTCSRPCREARPATVVRRSTRLRRTKRMTRALLERCARRVLSRVHISPGQTRPGQYAAYRQRCTRKPRIRPARLQCRFL